jgi:L-fucose isomerase-like protein
MTNASSFHCGNWAKSFLPDIKIANAPILGSILGVENTYGALDGRTPAGPLTYGRITTADAEGKIRCYVGEGELTNDEAQDVRQPRRGQSAEPAKSPAPRLRKGL